MYKEDACPNLHFRVSSSRSVIFNWSILNRNVHRKHHFLANVDASERAFPMAVTDLPVHSYGGSRIHMRLHKHQVDSLENSG